MRILVLSRSKLLGVFVYLSVLDGIPSTFDIETENVDVGLEASVMIALAVSDDERKRVGLQISLSPFKFDGVLCHEFAFAIFVEDLEADDVFVTHDRDIAKGYLPSEVRPHIMPCVCGAAKALVSVVQPAAIFRVTKSLRPPEKALHKHHMITDTLLALGYKVTQSGIDPAKRNFWVLEQ